MKNVTPEWAYLRRREFMLGGLAALGATTFGRWAAASDSLTFKKNPAFQSVPANHPLTDEKMATNYNNFYEFSLEKGEVAEKVKGWNPGSWSVAVSGLMKNPKTWNLEDVIKKFPLEERIYRHRCVEAWSMVLPWTGFPLSLWLKEMHPDPAARYVKFTSLGDSRVMPGLSEMPSYPWPYVEGLTIEEAMHPLTIMAVGLYGKRISKQNGAPIRLVVPWKYGFKSIKSVVKIELVKEPPKTMWNVLAPKEYGFNANVNPNVSHPRWSQDSERVIDGSFIPRRIPTLMFNGYEKEVASLYKGVDLTKFY